jgi:ABC-type glycerol-3-phosphate transport system substrate-binding protein
LKLKKIITGFLLICLLLVSSSCRKKGGDATEATEQPAAARESKKEIEWWLLNDLCENFKGQIRSFEKANSDYKINCKEFTNSETYKRLLVDKMAEGAGPDIFSAKNTWIDLNQRKISPLPPEIMTSDQFRSIFFAVAGTDLIIETEQYGELIYGMPLYIDTLALYYNKSVFADNLPETDVPEDDWEGIKEQVFALTKKDNSVERFALSGLAAGRADNINYALDIFKLLLIQHNTELTDEKEAKAIFADEQGTKETGEDYYRGQETLKLYTSFGLEAYKNHTWNQLITSFTGSNKEVGVFVNGKVAMVFGYSDLYSKIEKLIEEAEKKNSEHITIEEVGITTVPQLKDPSISGEQDALASYYPLTVSRNSEYSKAAWEFLVFLASKDSLLDYHYKTNRPTSRKDMVEEQMSKKPFGVFARQASYAKSIKTYSDLEFAAIFTEAINEVAKSKTTVEEALKLAQKRFNCVLEKYRDPVIAKDCMEVE